MQKITHIKAYIHEWNDLESSINNNEYIAIRKSHWGTLVPRINVENSIKYAPTTV
jgi:hypothetical protein